jgi:protein PsiE
MDQNHNSETAPLSDAAVKFNSVLTFAQGFALVAIAVAALVGICSSIWSMVELEKASLGDLLLLFLYIEILSMVKGSALGTREIPIRTPVALAIVAVARYIVVDVHAHDRRRHSGSRLRPLGAQPRALPPLSGNVRRMPPEERRHAFMVEFQTCCGCSSMAEQ